MAALSPQQLINAQRQLLEFRRQIIEENQGIVAQFIGDCVTAYWPTSDLTSTLRKVQQANLRMLRERPALPAFDYCLTIRFCAAELVGDFFGPPTSFRFQVVGKARSRTEALPSRLPGRDSVFTDSETVRALPDDLRGHFTPLAGHQPTTQDAVFSPTYTLRSYLDPDPSV